MKKIIDKIKKNMLYVLLGVVGFSFIFILFFGASNQNETTLMNTSEVSKEDDKLQLLLNNIRSGGPPPDGIPPIEEPKYQNINKVNMHPNEPVFIQETNEGIFVYPQRILVYHEIVNEEFDGVKTSITYCPLTGSALTFDGEIDGEETTYGTSGKLVNSNLVMYDRKTNSYIPQILGTAIKGELSKTTIDLKPLIWSTWERAQNVYDDANVLTEDTGFIRNYDRDPYGSYLENNTYYQQGDGLFPVVYENKSEQAKEIYIGVRTPQPVGIQKEFMRNEKLFEFQAGNQSLVAFYDEPLDAVFVYDRNFDGQILTFEQKNNVFIDQNENEWNTRGQSTTGSLRWAPSFDVYWFAWFAFFPETKVYK